jgi:hypothetical protein
MYLQHTLKKRTKTELFKFYESVKYFTNGLFVFDELETMLHKCETISLTDISKWQINETKPVIRMVFICNDSMFNKLSAIVPLSLIVRLEYPSPKSIFSKCVDIMDKEHIETTDQDVVRLKSMIVEMKEPRMIFNSLNLIGIADNHKDITLDMYSIYRTILRSDVDIDKKMRYFSCESGTIPIIVQENYIDANLNLSDMCDVSESMSLGDVYHKAIFVNNDPIQMNIYACLSSMFHYLLEPDAHNRPFFVSPRFGSMWTRMSAMYQKRKYWSRFDEYCHDPSINGCTNVTFMNDIYKHLFTNNKSQFMEFLNYYQLKANVDTAFDLYNSYNVSPKTTTKKSFVTALTKLNKGSLPS